MQDCVVVSIAWVAAFEVDDAAFGEAVFGQDVLHYAVVAVGVDPDGAAGFCGYISICPVEHLRSDVLSGCCCCQSVDDIVGFVVRPGAFY